MTYEPQARKIAEAIRVGASRDAEQRGTGRYTAEVKRWDGPETFQVDVMGLDLELDEGYVTLSQSVRSYDRSPGIVVGDSLVLVEVDEGEFSAVAVESGETDAPEPADGGTLADLQAQVADLLARVEALEGGP